MFLYYSRRGVYCYIHAGVALLLGRCPLSLWVCLSRRLLHLVFGALVWELGQPIHVIHRYHPERFKEWWRGYGSSHVMICRVPYFREPSSSVEMDEAEESSWAKLSIYLLQPLEEKVFFLVKGS